MKLNQFGVHCDGCGLDQITDTLDDLAKWAGKACPKCGRPDILTLDELAFAQANHHTMTSQVALPGQPVVRLEVRMDGDHCSLTQTPNEPLN